MAAAVLQPPESKMTSLAPEISKARQRRRRSTRRSEGLTRSPNLETQGTRELGPSALADNVSTSDAASSVLDSTVGSVDSALTGTSQRSETARQRRRARLKQQSTIKSTTNDASTAGAILNPQPHSAGNTLSRDISDSVDIRPLPELEDSTVGVANLLQQKLQTEESNATRPTSERLEVSHQTEAIDPSEGGNADTTERHNESPLTQDRPLPQLVPVDTGSIGTSDHEDEACTDILGITIHGTDHLKASVKISHPCVRVTVVDASLERLGELMKKSRPDRCVTSFYERGNPNVDYILPMLTQPYKNKENSDSLQPTWEETLIFNERLTRFTNNDNVIIFFELLDFSTTSNSKLLNRQKTVASSEQTPWYHIAWGFLKPAGKISKSMMGQRSRIQLYRFPKRGIRVTSKSREVFNLWLRHQRTPYPSTLYVTLKALPGEGEGLAQPQGGRSTVPTLAEVGTLTFEQLVKQQKTKSLSSLTAQPSALLSETTRLPGQPCHIPTTHSTTLHPTDGGCSSLKFSHSGRLLAAGCASHNDIYPVIFYEVPSFQAVLVTDGHQGIVYDMCWGINDNQLATASGDGLVKVWSMSNPSPEPLHTLPHPCYVYSVCLISESHLFTGAYDGNIRLWALPQALEATPQLVCELRGHSGLVNCLVWSDGSLYAGDSRGEVGVWREGQGEWRMVKNINVLKACALTSMSLHPNGRKLLLQTVKGSIVMVDLRIDRVCSEYRGITLSQSQRSSSLVSPCGGLVFAAGSPEIHVWNSNNGKHMFSYTQELPIKSTVSAMAFHPSEQMAVFSAYGTHEPIIVLVHKNEQASKPSETNQKQHRRKEKGVSKLNTGEISLMQSSRLSEVAKTLNKVTSITEST